ncbi:diaminopimelate decarboxylase [Methylophilaceae bacterium]|jgi:diaminopimelate decarboxylase|nr:diaminopimelate decarboxylase [Methylophilaceae bacterium]|tara:strand:+ start:2544 stop:3794 length:1251 start_codon:yes stop_codon:yes gene_type:complete
MTESILKLKDGKFYIENLLVENIAKEFGTPSYIYSKKIILDNYLDFKNQFNDISHLICFAVKANPNIAILNLLAKNGAGFDIVSSGELRRVIAAEGDPKKVVFSGVGKSKEDIELAIKHDILTFNVESEAELHRIQSIAKKLSKVASISIRVNPDVDPKTHPYISTGLKDNKFGVDEQNAISMYKIAKDLDSIKIKGIDCHIGSQITELHPFEDSIKKLLTLLDHLNSIGISIEHIDIGGGIGIQYSDEMPPTFADYAKTVKNILKGRDLKIIFEPGRALIGKAGLLLAEVEYIKNNLEKNFIIINAAMNDLMRPALYGAFHEIINLSPTNSEKKYYDIVGPVCETGDFLGKDRLISAEEGNILAILDAGAYGMSMSSNYNSRPKASEILVDDNKLHLIRCREDFAELINGEQLLP